jgi:hypothetical protein
VSRRAPAAKDTSWKSVSDGSRVSSGMAFDVTWRVNTSSSGSTTLSRRERQHVVPVPRMFERLHPVRRRGSARSPRPAAQRSGP